MFHQLFVDGQAAGSVQHVDVVAAHRCLGFGAFGNRNRLFASNDRQRVDADLFAQNRQLFHRRRTVHIERSHQDLFALAFFQTFGQFRGRRGFTAALQADHQDRGRGAVDFQVARFAFAAQGVDQRVVHDLDDLLARRDRFGDRLTGGFVLNCLNEIARNGQRNVGF